MKIYHPNVHSVVQYDESNSNISEQKRKSQKVIRKSWYSYCQKMFEKLNLFENTSP